MLKINNPEYTVIAKILITTQADKDEINDAFETGINVVIYKPFSKEQFKTKFEEFIS